MPQRIGPFALQSEDGRYRLKVGLIVQLQMRAESRELGPAKGHETRVRYLARRVRPSMRGNALSKDLGFYLHLSTAPGSLEFMDWYLDFRFHPYFRLRGGQFKIPFTRYRIQSFRYRSKVLHTLPSSFDSKIGSPNNIREWGTSNRIRISPRGSTATSSAALSSGRMMSPGVYAPWKWRAELI